MKALTSSIFDSVELELVFEFRGANSKKMSISLSVFFWESLNTEPELCQYSGTPFNPGIIGFPKNTFEKSVTLYIWGDKCNKQNWNSKSMASA